MPAGETISDNLELTFLSANDEGTTAIDATALKEETETAVGSQNIGLKQGRYNINGKKVVVK